MSTRMVVAVFALGTAVGAICFLRPDPNRPPLHSESSDYWTVVRRSTETLDMEHLFPEGFPTNLDFATWFVTTTNETARAYAARAVVLTDRTNSIRFLEWLVRFRPEWRAEREWTYLYISSTYPYWDEHRPKKWNQKEIAVFSEYFRRCLETETSWACRRKIDNFFLHTDPFWKPSKERLAFLERSFGLPGSNSNTILRLIATRTEPVDVERYESRMRMIQH